MARRPRIHWQLVDKAPIETVWTPGWLPDTDTLRWSLANDLRIEGLRDGWHKCFEASNAAVLYEGYVTEDEDGDFVETSPEGVLVGYDVRVQDFRPATFARLDAPIID